MAGSITGTSFNSIILQNVFFQSIQTSLASFITAQSALFNKPSIPNPFSNKIIQNLQSQSSLATAVANTSTLTNAKIDTANTSLTSVQSLLSDAVSLATSAVSSPSASLNAALQSTISQIQSELAEAKSSTGAFINTQFTNGATPSLTSATVTSLDSTANISSSGTTFNVTVNDAGSQGSFTAVSTGAGTLTSAVTFNVSGPDGSTGDLTFSSGTTVADIATEINESSGTTGVTATVSGNDVIVTTNEFGSTKSVTVTETSDPSGEITSTTDAGTDVDIDVDDGTTTVNIVNSGRTGITGTIEGVNFELNLVTDTSVLAASAATAGNSFTVYDSGLSVVGSSGKVLTTIGAPALDFGTLDIADLDISTASGAVSAIAALTNAQDITSSSQEILGNASTLTGSIITNATALTGTIETEVANIETTASALQLFEDVKNENTLSIAAALLQQLQGAFFLSLTGALSSN